MIVSVVSIYDAYLGDPFISLTLPPLISCWEPLWCSSVCLVDSRCGLQQHCNDIIQVFILV